MKTEYQVCQEIREVLGGVPVAGQVFALQVMQGLAEEDAARALLEAAGIDYDAPWPLQDITFDNYDGSFEFKDVNPAWKMPEDALPKFWALGFIRCWICYRDGREEYYAR